MLGVLVERWSSNIISKLPLNKIVYIWAVVFEYEVRFVMEKAFDRSGAPTKNGFPCLTLLDSASMEWVCLGLYE